MIATRARPVTDPRRFGSGFCAFALVSAAAIGSASAETPTLKPYTTPDKSASASVPAGWKVVRGDNTVIAMTGPQGESVSLGVTAITQNAASPGGKPLASGISFVMPYATEMPQKFVRIFQFASESAHQTAPQFTFASATPLRVAPILGQCARFLGAVSDASKPPANFESAMCSFPPDFVGVSKNVLLYAQVPTSLVPQERSLVESVLKSYRIPPQWLKKKLAPFYAPPKTQMPIGASNAAALSIMGSVWAQEGAADTAADCFDVSVLRETPTYRLPAKCGGPAVNQ